MINNPYFLIKEEADYLVVYKNPSIPSSPGKTPNSCLEYVAKDFPQVMEIKGKREGEGGLLHRLDTETAGILLFAKNQDFYDHIIFEQDNLSFIKYYTAYCTCREKDICNIDFTPRKISSFFRPFGPKGGMVKPIFNLEMESLANKKKSGNKKYITDILSIKKFYEKNTDFGVIHLLKIKASISLGFRHQVRSHLASENLPVFGDKLYNKDFPIGNKMLFFASGIEFDKKNYYVSEELLDSIAEKTFFPSAIR